MSDGADRLLWHQPFTIRAYEVGPDETASVLTVCDLFQEAAGEHARALGVEHFDTDDGRTTWVLSRLSVRLHRRPRMREPVTVETWPSDRDRLRATRDLRLLDAEGAEIASGATLWFLIDTVRRRPVRLPPEMDGFALRDRPHALPFSDAPQPPEAVEAERRFAVRRSDLDRVGHANNVRFVEWALEALDTDDGLREIDVLYRAEAVYGDTVVSRVGPLQGGARDHVLVRDSDDHPLAFARTQWT